MVDSNNYHYINKMNIKVKCCLPIIMGLFLTISLHSQEGTIYIKDISLTGLKRTREEVVFQIIKPVSVGAVYTEKTKETIIQRLRETGIFVPDIKISTDFIGNDAYINITIRDKWTLIPIPIVSVSKGESWNAGILAIENNLFGYYKTLGLGFFYGSQGWTLLSFYSDPYFLHSDFSLKASLAAGLDQISDLNDDESVVREYETDRLGLSFGLEYPLTQKLKLGGTLEYDLSQLRENSSDIFADQNSIEIKSNLSWNDVYYDIPYEKGLSAEFTATAGLNFLSKTFFPIVQSDIKFSFSPWFKHLIGIKSSGGWGKMPIQKQFRLGGQDGTRVLPMGKIAADEYVYSTAIYNIPLWIFKGGTISSKVFYEIGYFKSDIIDRKLFHGPGLGLEFFINKLAIPAVGLNLGWNLETRKIQFSAGIGM